MLNLEVIETTAAVFLPAPWLVHYPRVNLTDLYLDSGREKEGLALALESLPILEQELGAERRQTIRLRRFLALLRFNLRQRGEAIAHFASGHDLGPDSSIHAPDE